MMLKNTFCCATLALTLHITHLRAADNFLKKFENTFNNFKKKVQENTDSGQKKEPGVPLTILNEDTIICIFNHLPLRTQLDLSCTCKQFYTLYNNSQALKRSGLSINADAPSSKPLLHSIKDFFTKDEGSDDSSDEEADYCSNKEAIAYVCKQIEEDRAGETLTIKNVFDLNIMKKICESLTKTKKITNLCIISGNFDEIAIPSATHILTLCTHNIKTLSLDHIQWMDPDSLATILQASPHLEELHCTDLYYIGSKDMSGQFLPGTRDNNEMLNFANTVFNIKKISLIECSLVYKQINWLVDALKNNKHVIELNLQKNHLSEGSIVALKQAADSNGNVIKKLDLSNQHLKKRAAIPYDLKRKDLEVIT